MAITVKMDLEDFVDLLIERLQSRWTNDPIVLDLFRQYYESYYYDGQVTDSIAVIVDNDYVNYTNVYTADELSREMNMSVEEAYDEGIILAEETDYNGDTYYLVQTSY